MGGRGGREGRVVWVYECLFLCASLYIFYYDNPVRLHTLAKRGARLSTERPVPSWHYDGCPISSTRPDSCALIACPRFVFTRGLFPMPRLR